MIDTHAHLLMIDDVEQKINTMKKDGLDAIVTIGTTVQDSVQSVEFANKHENVYATVGIYPEFSETVTDADLEKIKELAKNEKVVAIGEIGLDYHREPYNKESQRWLFLKQLEIANEVGIPFCVHCRGAAQDVYEILKENQHLLGHLGLMHCYSEGDEWIDRFVELGMYISFSGSITFKKNDRSFLKRIPKDKILVETDAPYLSPEPFRGRKNEPKNVRYTLNKIAEELEIDAQEFDKITTENARRFYFKMNKNKKEN